MIHMYFLLPHMSCVSRLLHQFNTLTHFLGLWSVLYNSFYVRKVQKFKQHHLSQTQLSLGKNKLEDTEFVGL